MPSSTKQTGTMAEPLYRPLSNSDVKRLADAAFDLLERGGMAVHSQSALEAFEKVGAQVDRSSRLVRLPRALVEDAIASNPSSITLYSRDGSRDIQLEGCRVHCGTGGTALYVLDSADGERRPAVIDDLVLNARMVEELDNVDLHTINVFPHDVKERDAIDVNRFFHSFEHTNKHVNGGVYSIEGCRKVVEMAQMIAGGEAALRQRPFVSFITLLISPFKIDDRYGEMTCYFAREGLPVVVPTEPICGTTAPITLAGNVLVHIAETLAGIALVQAVKKGAPGICGSVGSIPDLQTMNHLSGPIERAMINAAVAQLAQHFSLPLYSTGGTTDAKSVDVQAAYESAMSNLLVTMSGANYIHDSVGLMEADLTVSYEKLAIDNEILGMCHRVMRGIEVNDDTMALELMVGKGPGEDYMVEDHTIRHMRNEFYVPTLANRQKRDGMDCDGDALSRARQFVQQVRSSTGKGLLPEDLRARLTERFPELHRSSFGL